MIEDDDCMTPLARSMRNFTDVDVVYSCSFVQNVMTIVIDIICNVM